MAIKLCDLVEDNNVHFIQVQKAVGFAAEIFKVCRMVSFVLFLTLIGLYELGIPVPVV